MKLSGWFLKADIVVDEVPDIDERIQEMLVNTVTDREPANNKRFQSNVTHSFDLKAKEKDIPLTLNRDMQIIHKAEIFNAEVI